VSESCHDCGWRDGRHCRFPLPEWLFELLAALPEDHRLNRIPFHRDYTSCATWKPESALGEAKRSPVSASEPEKEKTDAG